MTLFACDTALGRAWVGPATRLTRVRNVGRSSHGPRNHWRYYDYHVFPGKSQFMADWPIVGHYR
ncbi:hypothetical protein [Mycobacterium malmoense]|uniref:hypothetical protein n=1 Tax=Mycobacterium malmoense TaxID=1780 RepID=UPI00111C9235|nr:hypothetical protein [Mycobacterium malmoense]UNB94524.1 hypothetical protein H5T25_00305 [Mycobacterium malmoense]